jgi:hypothetical protein
MAEDGERKRGFPYMAVNAWAQVRRSFAKSLPSKVDVRYLEAVLSISEKGARNIVPQLRTVGLIDDDGSVSDLGKRFRLDDDYLEVAAEVVERVYPEQLRTIYPGPEEDVNNIAKWFMRETGGGQAASLAQARFYLMLVSGQLPSAEARTSRATPAKAPSGAKPRATTADATRPNSAAHVDSHKASPPLAAPQPSRQVGGQPDLHLDIQIHIDANASVEQIDAVFASMAKHIYKGE